MMVTARSDVAGEPRDGGAWADDDEGVAGDRHMGGASNLDGVAVLDSAEAEARIALAQLAERGQTGAIDAHGPVDERLGRRRRWRFERRWQPEPPSEDQRQDDDHRGNGRWVGQR